MEQQIDSFRPKGAFHSITIFFHRNYQFAAGMLRDTGSKEGRSRVSPSDQSATQSGPFLLLFPMMQRDYHFLLPRKRVIFF